MVTKSQNFLGISGFRRNSEEFCGEKFLGISSEFSNMSLKTVIPQKSIILGTNSGEFFENFRGISYRKGFSRNSSEILQKKSPRLENLGKLLTFVTWELIKSVHLTYRSCAYDLQKCTSNLQLMTIRPTNVCIRPTNAYI